MLIIGIIGGSIILIAFLLNQIGKLKREFFIYDFLNFIGALLLSIYAYLIESYPFMVLNGIWTIFSLKDSITDILKKKIF
jgi:hypothetical protein